MGWRTFNRNDPADIKLLEDICKNSGSKSVSRERAYIRRALYQSQSHPEKLWCEILDECAFYLCTQCKNHVRCILTVVSQEKHGQHYGKKVNDRCLQRMAACGIDTFKFRTNQNEPAVKFWLKQGATIVGLNGNDFEMEIKIKI